MPGLLGQFRYRGLHREVDWILGGLALGILCIRFGPCQQLNPVVSSEYTR